MSARGGGVQKSGGGGGRGGGRGGRGRGPPGGGRGGRGRGGKDKPKTAEELEREMDEYWWVLGCWAHKLAPTHGCKYKSLVCWRRRCTLGFVSWPVPGGLFG